MIYEVVEWVKDALTDNNSPCDQCPLCLCDFMKEEEFTKTDCYHYFHTVCLARYVCWHQQLSAEEREEGGPLECPVCRETISHDSSCMKQTVFREGGVCGEDSTREREREGEELVFVPSQSLRQWQHQMAVLLRQQKERGGVIDLTAKDDVIDLSWVSQRPKEVAAMADKTEEKKAVREKGKTESVRVTDQESEVATQSSVVHTRPTRYSNSHSQTRHRHSGYSSNPSHRAGRVPEPRPSDSRPRYHSRVPEPRPSDSRPRYHSRVPEPQPSDSRSIYHGRVPEPRPSDSRSRYHGRGTGDHSKQCSDRRSKNGMRTEQHGNEPFVEPTAHGHGRECSHKRDSRRYESRCDFHRQEGGGGEIAMKGQEKGRRGRGGGERKRDRCQQNGVETREEGVMQRKC